mmetsp:Transcript_8541/g.13508  ORF Transcript_8541/g.13508 Transcript_8541/m.13508 type:complete len:282 (+) Transcript_8541:3465-4310(+)
MSATASAMSRAMLSTAEDRDDGDSSSSAVASKLSTTAPPHRGTAKSRQSIGNRPKVFASAEPSAAPSCAMTPVTRPSTTAPAPCPCTSSTATPARDCSRIHARYWLHSRGGCARSGRNTVHPLPPSSRWARLVITKLSALSPGAPTSSPGSIQCPGMRATVVRGLIPRVASPSPLSAVGAAWLFVIFLSPRRRRLSSSSRRFCSRRRASFSASFSAFSRRARSNAACFSASFSTWRWRSSPCFTHSRCAPSASAARVARRRSSSSPLCDAGTAAAAAAFAA